ncbi:MAG: hypothetical protein ACRC7N_16330 [Clostridium sp.]
MKNPNYLYHYTSIETLNLILKNKTIRFNSLLNVDDKEEKMTFDLGDFGKYIFVSCWTADRNENEDLWERYGFSGKGVRIKLHSYPFVKYHRFGEGIKKPFYSYIDDNWYKNGLINLYGIDNEFLVKVKYTDDINLVYPKIEYIINDKNKVYLINKIGQYKSASTWKCQNEWRYRIHISPISKYMSDYLSYDEIQNAIFSGADLDFSDIFLKINEKYLQHLEILMGPNTTDEDKIKVQHICSECNIQPKIFNSVLKK